jgi:hypothetical protein
MAHPPPPKPAAPTPPTAAEQAIHDLKAAEVIEKHVDAWIKGQGATWQGGDVSIGEHKRHRAGVLAELVALYKAAGWAGATITDDPEHGAVLHLVREPATLPTGAAPPPDAAAVSVTA